MPKTKSKIADIILDPDLEDEEQGTALINTDIIKSEESQYNKIEKTKDIDLRKNYLQWYVASYTENYKYSPMPGIQKFKHDYKYGSYNRTFALNELKYHITYSTMNTIVIVLKLYDNYLKKEINYGTLFCELISDINPKRHGTYVKLNKTVGNVLLTFYCASPSYISCDGEYRTYFTHFMAFINARNNYPDIWDEIHEYVNRIMIRRQWSPFTTYFYPKLEQQSRNIEVESAIKNESVIFNLLAVSWFLCLFDEFNGDVHTHINKNFREVMLRDKERDIKFIQELIKKYSFDKVIKFKYSLIYYPSGFLSPIMYNQYGYKMIPLNIKEVQDPLKIKYKPWREWFISNRCNDLVINNICPSFSLIGEWFYIKNSKKGLYDNKSQYDRMKHSELAKDIIKALYEAQRGTYFAAENLKTINKSSAEMKKWVSSKFKKLNEKIDGAINFTIEELIMSEVTLSFVNENVGRTFSDLITNIGQKHETRTIDLYFPAKDSEFNYFAKYMFEICYALFILNSRLGVIHGDFHLNNATIGNLFYIEDADGSLVKAGNQKYKVLYAVNDEHQYVFPTNGSYACIIDFSRSIIHPDYVEGLRDESLPSTYTLVSNDERFKEHEINSLLTIYTQLFPNKLKQKDELAVLFKNYFSAVFRLLTCIDLYMFSARMLRMLDGIVGKKGMDLVDRINKQSESYIATEMNNLFANPQEYSQKILGNDWPILNIIKKCFAEFNDGYMYRADAGVISDVYIATNEMKFSTSRYNKFPDYLKYMKHTDGQKVVNNQYVEKAKAEIREAYEKDKLNNLDMLNFIAMRHMQKLVV